ncbi:MAG: hypothetical protein KDD37_01770, partial [Bdellovibrionales bacterium]|nr:hypothetical protein [Bdellovibrionales bacterium]
IKMLISRICFFLMILCLSSMANAHQSARGKVVAFAGPYIYQTETNIDLNDANSPILGGFAMLTEGGVDKNGGVELALIYLHKMYLRRSEDQVVAEKIKRMQINVGYRHWFTPRLSIGLSYYSSYAMGDPAIIHSDFSGSPIYTTAHKVAETGFDLSIQAEVYTQPEYTIVADVRYSYSLSARSGEEANTKGIIIGYKKSIDAN